MNHRNTTAVFSRRPRSAGGFTLIEIMTASTISLVIITALLGVTQMVLSNFRDIRGGSLREADAGVALDMMVRDLESLVVSSAPDGQNLMVTAESVEEGRSVWLTFLGAPVDDDPAFPGAMRAISYRLDFKNTLTGASDSNSTYALYRVNADAETTFVEAVGVSNLQDDFWSSRNTTDVVDYLVGNVVGFEIRFQRADNQEWTTEADLPIDITANGARINVTDPADPDSGTKVPGGFTGAEVTLTALDPQGAKLVASNAVDLYDSGGDFNTEVLRFKRTYVQKTVVLPQIN